MLEQFTTSTYYDFIGLCACNKDLCYRDIININAYDTMDAYILNNRPKKGHILYDETKIGLAWFWDMYDYTPRIQWLKQQITIEEMKLKLI